MVFKLSFYHHITAACDHSACNVHIFWFKNSTALWHIYGINHYKCCYVKYNVIVNSTDCGQDHCQGFRDTATYTHSWGCTGSSNNAPASSRRGPWHSKTFQRSSLGDSKRTSSENKAVLKQQHWRGTLTHKSAVCACKGKLYLVQWTRFLFFIVPFLEFKKCSLSDFSPQFSPDSPEVHQYKQILYLYKALIWQRATLRLSRERTRSWAASGMIGNGLLKTI